MLQAAFTPLARGTYLEGLAWDAARNLVWYSDVVAGGVHGVTPTGEHVATLNPERMWTGGILVNGDGKVLSSGQGGIMWNDPQTGRSGWLISEIGGTPINGINEMTPDGAGGIYFGTVDLDAVIAAATPRPTAIYHLSAGGTVRCVAEGIGFTNAMMADLARRRFYCNDTFTGTIAFDIAPDGTLENRQALLAKPDADGMAIDEEGAIWLTGFSSADIARLAPDGSPLPSFPTPAKATTQVRFGGADRRDVYLVTVPADGGESLKDGVPLRGGRSVLYRTHSPIAGMELAPPAFKLG